MAAGRFPSRRGLRRLLLLLAALGGLTYVVLQGIHWLYPFPYREIIVAQSGRHGLDPRLVAAVIRVESRFFPGAVSSVGARGLMQILPETGRWAAGQLGLTGFRSEMLYDPVVNVTLGTWYLAHLLDQYEGRAPAGDGGPSAAGGARLPTGLPAALAAYNAGRQVVDAWLAAGVWDGSEAGSNGIPFPETRAFVRRVLRDYRVYRALYGPGGTSGRRGGFPPRRANQRVSGGGAAVVSR